MASGSPRSPSKRLLLLCICASFLNGVFLNVRGVALDDLASLSNATKQDLSSFFLASELAVHCSHCQQAGL